LSSGRVCKFDVEEDKEEFDTTLLERYIPARPFEDELLRELDGRGDDARFTRYSYESESVREGSRCCCGLVWVTLGDVTGVKRDSPMYEGE
jgi:hypothetical protein